MTGTRWLALALLALAPAHPVRAGLDGDVVTVEQHHPSLGSVIGSQDTVVEAGSADALVFGSQNATTVDVDPDRITLTLGCGFPACNRITNSTFSGFVLTGLDWSSPPGPPLTLEVEGVGKYFDPSRVALLPGRIEIDLWRDVWSDGAQVRITPVYAPQVAIDVIPGSDANRIPRGQRPIPVAVLGSPEIEVRDVDPFSLRLGPGEAPASWDLGNLVWWFDEEDVNQDGHADLVFRFDAREAAIPSDALEVCLAGEVAGLPFTACDAVASVP